ncbi:MAG TPA: Ppx/GppA phosphatase family protein [Casimicrobiaceae bacterium]|nr:Ppx/GppA phosphatase family protein [Casimicrobiaceae bacterium]
MTDAPRTLAVVDLGSNSFRLELGRVEGQQIFRLDTWRETIRFGAGLDRHGNLTATAQRAALACLARFAERLRGLHPSAVRAVATNTFRVARNAAEFVPKATAALGFPIDIIGGHEEARLIWLGVAHVLPPSSAPRLVIDIGGGSTEFIVGRGDEPVRLDSLPIGCVGMTQRFFPDGRLTAKAFAAARTHARAEIEAIARDFDRSHWKAGYASSGTALALADILEGNGLSAGGITPAGLARLEKRMIRAGTVERLDLAGLKPARAPVLAGGLAVMSAALSELRAERVNPVGGALRLGVLYDLLGRTIDRDIRAVTVERFLDRYRVDREHARRVAAMAKALYLRATTRASAEVAQRVEWAALLHEIGLTVSHVGFHKHGAYILQHADMPGFSSGEQERLALLVLACRGNLQKVAPALADADTRAQVLAIRLAVLMHHARRPIAAPRLTLSVARSIRFAVPARWLAGHPLTAHLLAKEQAEWKAAGHPLRTAA